MSRINFVFSWIQYETGFITSGPEKVGTQARVFTGCIRTCTGFVMERPNYLEVNRFASKLIGIDTFYKSVTKTSHWSALYDTLTLFL